MVRSVRACWSASGARQTCLSVAAEQSAMESVQQQLDTLKGQAIAAHIVLGSLGKALADSSPDALGLIERAFDNAANNAEHMAIRSGKAASPKQTVEVLRIVEEMRSA